MEVMEVPWMEVKTIFRFSFPFVLKVPFLTEAFIKASSTSLPIVSIKFSLALKLIWEKSKRFTSAIISLSCGGTICPPSFQYTLYPLYSGGLWEAVYTIPASHPKCLTAKESSGVGRKSSNKYTLMLFAEKTSATIFANSLLLCRQS